MTSCSAFPLWTQLTLCCPSSKQSEILIASNNNNNYYYSGKKRAHDAHYHDERHSSGKDESHESSVNPAYSDGEVSERERRDGTQAENYSKDG